LKVAEAYEFLKAGFAADRLAQAYIIAGDPAAEGIALAEMVLGIMFCDSGAEACGECRGCAGVRNRVHPDIAWVEPQKKSRLISIDQVRELRGMIFQTSFSGGWKACVMSGADRLSAEAANAFLKTLEEPPPRSVFFLLTDSPEFLLPTVISRCQRIRVMPDCGAQVREWQAEVVGILSMGHAGGNIGAFARAESLSTLLKRIKDSVREQVKETESEADRDEDSDTIEARVSARYREVRTRIMRFVLGWYRDVFLLVTGVEEDTVVNADCIDLIRRECEGMSYAEALSNIRAVEDMNVQFERNLTENQVLSLGFSRLGQGRAP